MHLTSQSPADSEVTVELRTSKATADVGSAVLGILSSVAAIGRVKDRVARSDPREVMELIDSEVDAARARRP